MSQRAERTRAKVCRGVESRETSEEAREYGRVGVNASRRITINANCRFGWGAVSATTEPEASSRLVHAGTREFAAG